MCKVDQTYKKILIFFQFSSYTQEFMIEYLFLSVPRDPFYAVTFQKSISYILGINEVISRTGAPISDINYGVVIPAPQMI